MSEPFLGEIRLVGFNFAPNGWALCQGQVLSIAQNSALFSLLGVMYGGNGTTNFNLPDLRGRLATGFGQSLGTSNYSQGQVGGQENVTLITSQLPVHTHALVASDQPASVGGASQNYLPSNGGRGAPLYANTIQSQQSLNPSSITPTGGSQPHTNLQPYLVLNYIIALQGIYPSRS